MVRRSGDVRLVGLFVAERGFRHVLRVFRRQNGNLKRFIRYNECSTRHLLHLRSRHGIQRKINVLVLPIKHLDDSVYYVSPKWGSS